MLTWIISTAQQARPKVIHHSEPVRAQVNRSSARRHEKALLVEVLAHFGQAGMFGRAGRQAIGAGDLFLGRIGIRRGVEHHSHSSAPFFQA